MIKATITFLNVHHGDSIIIEFLNDKDCYCCVIDTNTIKKNCKRFNPTVDFLKKKNIKKIDALIITHFDKDHILGIENILSDFEIVKLCVPPVFSLQSKKFNELIDRVKHKLKETTLRSKSEEVHAHIISFAKLLKFIKNNNNLIQELIGPANSFTIPGLGEVGKILLPLPENFGEIRQKILNDDFELRPFLTMNSVSIVLQLDLFNNKILLTGDSTIGQWNKQIKYMRKDQIHSLGNNYLKVPHHGSNNNNNQNLYEYFFGKEMEGCNLFVSCNGRSHPHEDFFTLIRDNRLSPHCTNLSHFCFPNMLNFYIVDPLIIKEAMPFLINYDIETQPIACQGDITLELTDTSSQIRNSQHYLVFILINIYFLYLKRFRRLARIICS